MQRALTLFCLAGAAISLLALLFAFAWNSVHNHLKASARKRIGIFEALIVATLAMRAIVYGSTKAPINTPPRLSAPRRTRSMPAQPQFTAEEIAAGYVLWRVGTNETWSFVAPTNAAFAAKWSLRGAADDTALITNEAASVLMDTFGGAQIDGRTYNAADFQMAVLPMANWPLLGQGQSAAWVANAPCRSLFVTWQNVLAGRDLASPASVQLELLSEGDYICRYDWSLAGGNESNVTSRSYYRIRPDDLEEPDRDGDGVPTATEVMELHTDPGLADSDGDGIGDGSDPFPLDPDSNGDGVPDGMTASEYWSHPLWTGGQPWDVSCVAISLNEPVAPPARAVLVVGDLPIILTTNAVYRLRLEHGVKYDVRLVTNHAAPVNLSLERDEE